MHPDKTPTHDIRPFIWLRFAAAAATVLLVGAMPVSAQFGLPAPGLPATSVPDLPIGADAGADTPLGGAKASADGTSVQVCAQTSAHSGQATDLLGAGSLVTSQLPALPVGLPALPQAGADVDACAEADAGQTVDEVEQQATQATGKVSQVLDKIQGFGRLVAGAFGF